MGAMTITILLLVAYIVIVNLFPASKEPILIPIEDLRRAVMGR